MLQMIAVKPQMRRGNLIKFGISKNITDDWFMLKSVIMKNAHASEF
jgi:hypothetical protein